MSKQFRFFAGVTLALVLTSALPASAAERELIDGEGVVQEVALSSSTVLITGLTYRVEVHADVNVGGLSSSIAALEEGMKVSFRYEMPDELFGSPALQEMNVIYELEQLPDSYVIEEF